MKKRYPGPLPFSYDDRNLFFGREQEIEYLTTLIINNQITVLHGKSGYGKSSLINAGLIPSLLEHFNCEIIRVRFYNYDKAHPLPPLDTFVKTVGQYLTGKPYLDGLLTAEPPSAWRYFKSLQYGILKKFPPAGDENSTPPLSYILVIDQFEELFTYPKEAVIALGKAFQEILLHRIPEQYQESLKEGFRNHANLEAYKDELSILEKDIPLKVIFSLRTDRFNYLTHLVRYIPTLLSNTYKVRRMTPLQVRTAIVEPALVHEDNFQSPPYTYKESIVQSLIDFLNTNTKDEEDKIEVFEMQIICQKLETLLIEYLAKNPTAAASLPVLFKEDVILQSTAIKDKEHPYAEIIKNYYRETIEGITEPVEQLSARFLIEFKLIDSATNNRISLDNAFVKQIGISDAVLRHLIDRRVIRIEINTVSGHSLEISHDSLVAPILSAAGELGTLATQLTAFYEAAIDVKIAAGRSVRDLINDVLLEEKEVKKAAAADLSEADFALLRANPVVVEKTPASGPNDIQSFGVKKIFQQTAQQSRAKAQQTSTRGWVRRFAIISVILVGVLAASLYIYSASKQREHRLRSLLFLSVADTVVNKQDALRLAYYIHQRKVLYKADEPILKKKLLNLMHEQAVQALFGYLTLTVPSSNLQREEIDLSQNGDFSIYHYKTAEAGGTWGNYYYCNNRGTVLKQFENVLYTYFTNRANIAVLAKAPSGSDSIFAITNKLARAFILLNCKTGTSQTISLRPGQYLYPPDYGGEAPALNNYAYRVQFNEAGSLAVPVYAPDVAANRQQVQLIPASVFSTIGPIETTADTGKIRFLLLNKNGGKLSNAAGQSDAYELVGVNPQKGILFYKSKASGNKQETIWRQGSENGRLNHSFTYNGIQSAVYNARADAMLVYTKDNRLYLLDSALQIKAGFQLTANDLYGFSDDGNQFFYVRNESMSFFKISNELIDLFNYDQVLRWLQKQYAPNDKEYLRKLKHDYELDF